MKKTMSRTLVWSLSCFLAKRLLQDHKAHVHTNCWVDHRWMFPGICWILVSHPCEVETLAACSVRSRIFFLTAAIASSSPIVLQFAEVCPSLRDLLESEWTRSCPLSAIPGTELASELRRPSGSSPGRTFEAHTSSSVQVCDRANKLVSLLDIVLSSDYRH